MFLDDQLYQTVKSKEIKRPEDFAELVNELYRLCDDYYKNKIISIVGFPYKLVSQEIDKVFKMWDFFIVKLEKENWFLIDVLKRYSYKKMFLDNDKLKEIYERGK
jgi:hypothetical protein